MMDDKMLKLLEVLGGEHIRATKAEMKVSYLETENQRLREALEFYASSENRSACLIGQYGFTEKYFTNKQYIVDVMETEYLKDNGDKAKQALAESGSDDG